MGATGDDDSCEYAEDNYDCDGNCTAEIDCAGICDGDDVADECGCCGGAGIPDIYCGCESECGTDDWLIDLGCGCGEAGPSDCDNECDSTAEVDECGVCGGDNSSCSGCMNEDACNFDADAIVDDGSCELHGIGDMNCDLILNVLDIVLMANMVLEDGYVEYADVNCDSFLNILDLVIMVDWVINGPPSNTVTDIDGNIYATVEIGACSNDKQLWMAENLKVTHYQDGTEIPYVNEAWNSLQSDGYCYYDNSQANEGIYGNLYNWYAVDKDRGLCMEGWHVPSKDEWMILIDYLDGTNVASGKLKECTLGSCPESEYWDSPNTGATNESGFTALPGGWRAGNNAQFDLIGIRTYFWTSTQINPGSNAATAFNLGCGGSNIAVSNTHLRGHGFSVRCIKDD